MVKKCVTIIRQGTENKNMFFNHMKFWYWQRFSVRMFAYQLVSVHFRKCDLLNAWAFQQHQSFVEFGELPFILSGFIVKHLEIHAYFREAKQSLSVQVWIAINDKQYENGRYELSFSRMPQHIAPLIKQSNFCALSFIIIVSDILSSPYMVPLDSILWSIIKYRFYKNNT